MSTTMTPDSLVRSRPSSGLAEVLDIILDRGLVIDVFVRVSLVGIELLTVDARIVVASVDTYLRFAEAVDRLNIRAKSEAMGIDDLFGGGGGVSGAVSSGLESVGDSLTGEDEEEEEEASSDSDESEG
jgi:gas vesicle structural protein